MPPGAAKLDEAQTANNATTGDERIMPVLVPAYAAQTKAVNRRGLWFRFSKERRGANYVEAVWPRYLCV
jgi:hypothetical protein